MEYLSKKLEVVDGQALIQSHMSRDEAGLASIVRESIEKGGLAGCSLSNQGK
jgi:hypothetical protein